MRRKIVLLIFFIAASFLIFLVVRILILSQKKEQITQELSTLKEIPLVDLDSNAFYMPPNRELFIIYFNSTCSYCHSEIQDIKENISKFSEYNIVLVSDESISAIKAFGKAFDLQEPNLFLTKIKSEDTFSTFGSLTVPHVFVYTKDLVLVKEFKGPHRASTILNSIH